MSFDPKQLQDLAKTTFNGLLADLSQDAREAVSGPAQAILTRAAELGAMAAAGDKLAEDTLRDLWAQSLMLAGAQAVKTEERILNSLRTAAIGVVKALVAAAVAA